MNIVDMLPREKIVRYGVSELSDSELMSVVLGSGCGRKTVFELAEELVLLLKTSEKMPNLDALRQVRGLGWAKACQVLACLEFSSRFLLGGRGAPITSPGDLVPQLAFLKMQSQEHMVCICLNGANRVVGVHTLTVGLANQTQIHPREAFQWAVQERAVAVIFAHNHPSGTLLASHEDLNTTRKLVEAGRVLDIPVLDHLIISREGWGSLKSTHPHYFLPT